MGWVAAASEPPGVLYRDRTGRSLDWAGLEPRANQRLRQQGGILTKLRGFAAAQVECHDIQHSGANTTTQKDTPTFGFSFVVLKNEL